MEIQIKQQLLQANEEKASELRKDLQARHITMLNLISGPGAGKTSLLEKSIPLLKSKIRIAVIEGDVETDEDAKRLEKCGVPIALINTNGACHLESVSIEKALGAFDLSALDRIFVENVGNLVCPAEFDIGEANKVAVLSVAEGDDKPIKYPLLFREATCVVLNKIDLLPHVDFSRDRFYADVKKINPNIHVIELSCKTGEGMDAWCEWVIAN